MMHLLKNTHSPISARQVIAALIAMTLAFTIFAGGGVVDAQSPGTSTTLPGRFLPFDSEPTPNPGETPDTDPLEEDVRRQFLDFFNSAFGAQLLRILRTLGVIVIIGGVALQASKSFRQGGGGMSQFFKGIMLPIIAGTLLVIPNILISIVGLVIAAIGWIITGLGNLI